MEYRNERRFKNPLVSGLVATIIAFVFASIGWPLWSIIANAIIAGMASVGLSQVEPSVASAFLKEAVEGTFFWLSINSWVWLSLIFGNYGKYTKTKKQPIAGIRYFLIGMFWATVSFVVFVGFIGLWWKPFNMAVMFMPKTSLEVALATKGWAASNFFAVTVLICQIPIVANFGKWPFAGKVSPPWDGFGAFMTSGVFALIVWMGMILPSFMELEMGGHVITSSPMGSWPATLAFCQCFIFLFLIPAEGGEGYPYKVVTKKQPYLGFATLIIALVGALGLRSILRGILTPFDLLGGQPVDLVISSLVLSNITIMLLWHHQFDDFPGEDIVKSSPARAAIRMTIVVVLGTIFGLVWMKTFHLFTFAGNNLGMNFPVLGIIAGQFVFMMPFLYMNTFFDKWPLIKQIEIKEEKSME